MSENTTPIKEPPKKPIIKDEFDALVIKEVLENPTVSNWKLSRNLAKSKINISGQGVYTRLLKRDYLKAELDVIRTHAQERMYREILPAALNECEETIKDPEIAKNIKFPYVKLVMDKTLKDATPPAPTIMIDKIQAYIANKLGE